jgi:hypothetical protein
MRGVGELPPIVYHIVAVTRLKKPHSGGIMVDKTVKLICNPLT